MNILGAGGVLAGIDGRIGRLSKSQYGKNIIIFSFSNLPYIAALLYV